MTSADVLTTEFQEILKDETRLREALDQTDIAPLLMTLAMLSADMTLLNKAQPYIQGAWTHMQAVPAELKKEAVDALVTLLKERFIEGATRPEISSEFILKIMSAGVGQKVPEKYLPLLLEEMQFENQYERSVGWREPDFQKAKQLRVAIIGAGFSGICAAIRFEQMGIPYVVFEKNADVGGTWLENTYPGCAVDTPNYFYSYSFLTNPNWSRHFSRQEEILSYAREAVRNFDIRSKIRFNCEVSRAHYCEPEAKWKIECQNGEKHEANVLITAVGLLNQPATPKLPGLTNFKGPVFHTARWDHEVDLTIKRVAIVGTGASAMQAAPSIASRVAELTIFQRTPHWVAYSPTYHAEVSAGMKWALKNIPYLNGWARFQSFWASSDGFHASLRADPTWPDSSRSLNEKNAEMRSRLEAHIKSELDGRPDLIEKCIPSYPPYGKRMLRDNHWFKMLKRPNVTLETRGIEKIDETGISILNGNHQPFDVIILATGFSANRMLWPIDIRGKSGATIRDAWGDEDPQAYLGIAVPDFPNLFVVYGPGTNLAHGGSAIFHSECQVRYIQQAIREMVEENIDSLEVKRDVHDQYVREFDAEHTQMVWAHPGVTNWYKNSRNKVTLNSPWTLQHYWELTRNFELADYEAKSKSAAD